MGWEPKPSPAALRAKFVRRRAGLLAEEAREVRGVDEQLRSLAWPSCATENSGQFYTDSSSV